MEAMNPQNLLDDVRFARHIYPVGLRDGSKSLCRFIDHLDLQAFQNGLHLSRIDRFPDQSVDMSIGNFSLKILDRLWIEVNNLRPTLCACNLLKERNCLFQGV